jgi:hypothetical protein
VSRAFEASLECTPETSHKDLQGISRLRDSEPGAFRFV